MAQSSDGWLSEREHVRRRDRTRERGRGERDEHEQRGMKVELSSHAKSDGAPSEIARANIV